MYACIIIIILPIPSNIFACHLNGQKDIGELHQRNAIQIGSRILESFIQGIPTQSAFCAKTMVTGQRVQQIRLDKSQTRKMLLASGSSASSALSALPRASYPARPSPALAWPCQE